MIGLDWVAFGTAMGVIITAFFSGLATLITARVHREVKLPNGDPRSAGEALADTAKAVGAGDTSHDDVPHPPTDRSPTTEPGEAVTPQS